MPKQKFNEDTLSEQPAIKQLKRLGYAYIHGDKLDPELVEDCERKSRRDVILVDRLKKKLAEINPHLTEETIKKAVRRITHIRGESILEANQNFHRDLIAGISIDQDIKAQRQKVTVNFIDFTDVKKNEFLVVNQFRVRRHKTNARPDIVIFVNGIPLVIIECKSPVAKSAGLSKAQRQLIRYQEEVPRLFRTNEILIGCNLFGVKYGTIGESTDHYHEWKESGDVVLPDMADHPTVKEMLRMGLIDKKDRNTYRHFSPPGEKYLDSYDIRQSQEDEATRPIKYESRLARLQVVKNSIDNLLKELFPNKSERELTEIKRRYATADAILGAPRRIERIAMDIVSHYREKIAPNNFKAQIVAANRKAADAYKKALDNLVDPSWSTVIMTVNNDDPQEWKRKYRRTADEEDHVSGKDVFQNPDNPLKFLIVCDKLLTGFDAPIEQVMYLDQRMKEHTLLQAIARTNRPYPRKNFGLVVDYVGVGRELAEALAIFDQKDLEGIFSVDDIKNELASLEETRKKAMEIFKRIKRDRPPAEIIQRCLEILKPEDVRAEFERLFREFARGIDVLMPDPCVEPFLEDFKFLGTVREGAKNLYRDERLSLENCSQKVEKLIHAHITDAGIREILEPINITAPDFEEKLEAKVSDRAKASHLEYAIRDTIKAKAAEDPHFYESLQGKLESIIESDQERREEEAELLKDLLSLSKEEERREAIAGEKGLTGDEFAFYGLLEPYTDSLFKGSEEEKRRVSKALGEAIRNEVVVDWIDKGDIKKEMRRNIKDILREKKFPAAKLDLFAREILDLAKVRHKD